MSADLPVTTAERIAAHEARIKALEDAMASMRLEVVEIAQGVRRLEIGEEKREAKVMAAIAKAEASFTRGLSDLRVEAAEQRAASWRKAVELVLGSGLTGGAVASAVGWLQQSLSG